MRLHVFKFHQAPLLLSAALALGVIGCAGNSSDSGSTPKVTVPSISAQPASITVTAGQTATFSVMATGTAPLSYQWLHGNTAVNGAMSSSYTTPPTTTANSGEQFQVQVSNTAGSITSSTATLTVNGNPTGSTDVVTHHYDISRSGVNPAEMALTTSNVNSTTFGKVGEFSVDGQIDGQALYVSQLAIPGQGTKNVLYVATENDSVYAVDADSVNGSNRYDPLEIVCLAQRGSAARLR